MAIGTHEHPPRARHGASSRDTAVLFFVVLFCMVAFVAVAEGDSLAQTLNPRRIHRLGFLSLAAALGLGHALIHGKIRIRANDPAFIIAGAFGLWAFATAFWSPSPTFSALKALEFMLVVVTFGAIVASVNRSAISAQKLAAVLAAASTTVVVLYLFLNLAEFGTLFRFVESHDRGPRFTLLYAHPLQSADVISLAVIAVAVLRGSLSWRLPLLAVLIVLVALTRSIGPGLGLATALLTIIWLNLGTTSRVAAILIFALAAILGLFFIDLIRSDLQITPDIMETLTTINGRIPLWKYALELAWEKPLAGHGFYAARFLLFDRFSWAGTAHNAFVEVLLTTGGVGLILLIAFISYVAVRALRLKNSMLIGITIYSLTHALTDYIIFSPDIIMATLLLGILVANRERENGAGVKGVQVICVVPDTANTATQTRSERRFQQ